jgi:hypothetical protein
MEEEDVLLLLQELVARRSIYLEVSDGAFGFYVFTIHIIQYCDFLSLCNSTITTYTSFYYAPPPDQPNLSALYVHSSFRTSNFHPKPHKGQRGV